MDTGQLANRVLRPIATCLLWGAVALMASPAHAQKTTLPNNHLSLGLGFPLAVGGLVKVEFLHRFDDRNFVKVGAGSLVVLNSLYMSYGRRFSDDPEEASYAYIGLENSLFVFSGGLGDAPVKELVPGIHAGIAKEWLTSGGWRFSGGVSGGLPWIIGLTFEVGR